MKDIRSLKGSLSFLAFSILLVTSCSQSNKKHMGGSRDTGTTMTLSKVTNSDSLLVPGKAAGTIVLGSNAADVIKALGKPDAGDAAMGKSVSTWFANHDSGSYASSIFSSRDMGNSDIAVIKQIRVTAPGFKTAGGVGTQSSLEEIRSNFKVQDEKGYILKQEEVHVYADTSGIAFEVDGKGTCIGIVIYPSGSLHPDTYARFIPDMGR